MSINPGEADPTDTGGGVYRAAPRRLTGFRALLRRLAPSILVVGLLVPLGCGAEREVGGSGRFEGAAEGGAPRVLVLTGTPYEMGVWQGRLLAPEIRRRVARPLDPVAADVLPTYEPSLLDLWPAGAREELRGVAAGAGVSEVELRRRELVREVVRWHRPEGPLAVAAWEALPEGGFHASWTALESMLGAPTSDLLWVERRPGDAAATRVLAAPGSVGGVAGVSDRGLVAIAGEDGSRQPEQRSLRGAAFPIGLRYALERGRSTDEVFAALPRTVGHRVLVAGPDRGIESVLALSSDDPSMSPPRPALADWRGLVRWSPSK